MSIVWVAFIEKARKAKNVTMMPIRWHDASRLLLRYVAFKERNTCWMEETYTGNTNREQVLVFGLRAHTSIFWLRTSLRIGCPQTVCFCLVFLDI